MEGFSFYPSSQLEENFRALQTAALTS